MLTLQFHVHSPGEYGAGIRPFDETVSITLQDTRESEIDLPEFTEHIRKTLRDWFDTPSVHTKAEYDVMTALEPCSECGQIKTHQNHWAPFGWHNFS